MEDAIVDFAGELMHGKELQVDSATMAVVVANVRDPPADYCLDAELFIEFAYKCLLGTCLLYTSRCV